MDRFFSPYPDQNYIVALNESSRGNGQSSNLESTSLRHIGLSQFTLPERLPGLVGQSTRGTHQWNSSYNTMAQKISASTKGQYVSTEYDHCSGPGVYLNSQSWPALNNCDVDSTSLYQVPTPFNAHAMNEPVSMAQWIPNGYLPEQLSSTHFTSVPSQPDPVMMQSTPLPNTESHPLTSHLSYHHCSADAVYPEQEHSKACHTTSAMTEAEDAVARIGSVLSNGKFVCDIKECGGRTFARQADLKRHHTTLHATNKPNFWCRVSTCRRSMSGGDGAFHRKDKLDAHVRSMHSSTQSG